MKLNEIRDNAGATHQRKVVGRGIGSGLGKTSGKGHKGQKARGTGKVRLGFEGGQNPIYRRLPKRGFNNPFAKNYFAINLSALNKALESNKIDAKELITYSYLKKVGVIKGSYDGLRILAKGGEISVALNFEIAGLSAKAKEIIEAKGGSITIIEPKKFVLKKKVY